MPTTVPQAVQRQLVRYEESAKAIASRQHVDLQELRWATHYVGRNIERLNYDVKAGLESITLQEVQVADKLTGIGYSLEHLAEIAMAGFQITYAQLGHISIQLQQMTQIMRYPARTSGAEQREKGIYLAAKGKRWLAVKSLQKAVDLNECDYISLYTLGYMFSSNKQYEAGAASFTESALFADDNPAMSANAAILAAFCFRQLNERQKAWAVVRRTLERNCPDLALQLCQYAGSEAEQEFATKQLATAFLIDAELAITAEAMELDGIDEAANAAYGQLADQITALKRAWRQLYEAGEAAGLPYAHPIPSQPKAGSSPRSLLMNGAIYRRNLQIAITEFKNALNQRLKSPIEIAELPEKPWYEGSLSWTSLKVSFWALVLAGIFYLFHNYLWAAFSLMVVVPLFGWGIYRERRFKPRMDEYEQSKREVEKANDTARKKNELVSTHREQIQLAIAEADKVLAATLPPAVPRAFSEDLIMYTQR